MANELLLGQVVIDGAQRRVVFLRLANGTEPARRLLETEVEDRDRRKLGHYFIQMAETGRVGGDGFKALPPWKGLFEFRGPRQARVLCWLDGRDVILADGEVKKRDKLSPTLLERVDAWHRAWEQQRRGRGG